MTPRDLAEFIRKQPWAIEATVSENGSPQAAVIGVVVSDALELFFDTLASSRKCRNLRHDARVAFVIGWDDARTLQLEGTADEPSGSDLERLKALYFARFPDGLERAKTDDLAYFRVRPTWARLSDFRGATPNIVEIDVTR